MLDLACYVCAFFCLPGRLWEFVKSDDGHLVFACIATVRAILHYGKRCRRTEIRELAALAAAAMLLAIAIIIGQSSLPGQIRGAFNCHNCGAKHLAPARDIAGLEN